MNKSQVVEQAHDVQAVTGQAPGYKEAGLTPKFAQRVIDLQDKKSQIKELEMECEPVKDTLELELAQSGFKSVMVDSYLVTLVDSTRTSLSKERLLELGVPASVIQQATKETPCTFLKVTDTEKGRVSRKERKGKVTPIKGKKHGNGSGSKKGKVK